MLLPTMNNREIRKEVLNDFEIILNSSTINRFAKEYYQKRKRLSINRKEDYPVFFEIKTKAKNNWMFMFSKNPGVQYYSREFEIFVLYYLYYYTNKGICVIQINLMKEIFIYYGHFFHRYRERMNLNLPNLKDVVMGYFAMNGTADYKFLPKKDGVIPALGIVDEGLLKGVYDEEAQWCVNKTFINSKTASKASIEELTKIYDEAFDFIRDNANDYTMVTKREMNILSHSLHAPVESESWKEKGVTIRLPDLNQKPDSATESDFMAFLKEKVKMDGEREVK